MIVTTAPGRRMIVLGFILIASLLLLTGPKLQDADSVMPAIMSVEKLTWYYWNQDRFGNLLPFLASPVHGAAANFYLQLFLRDVCGFTAMVSVLVLIGDRTCRYECFFLGVLAMLLCADRLFAPFFSAAVPQPVSCAVLAAPLWLLSRPMPTVASRMAVWLIAAALFWVAFFVNLSLIVLVLPMALLMLVLKLEPFGRPSTTAAPFVAAGLAWLHARLFQPHTPAGFSFRWDGLNLAATAIIGDLDLAPLATVLLAASGLAVFLRRHGPRRVASYGGSATVPDSYWPLCTALVATSFVYANLTWVRLNGNPSKYYYVIELFVVVMSASLVVRILRSTAHGSRIDRVETSLAVRLGLPLAALLAVAIHAAGPDEAMFVSDDPAHPLAVNQDVRRILRSVPAGRPMIAVGDYWTTVPLVYLRLTQGGRESYAVTDHWEPMKPEILGVLRSGRPFTLVCMPPQPPAGCLAGVVSWSGAGPQKLETEASGHGELAGGGSFTTIVVQTAKP